METLFDAIEKSHDCIEAADDYFKYNAQMIDQLKCQLDRAVTNPNVFNAKEKLDNLFQQWDQIHKLKIKYTQMLYDFKKSQQANTENDEHFFELIQAINDTPMDFCRQEIPPEQETQIASTQQAESLISNHQIKNQPENQSKHTEKTRNQSNSQNQSNSKNHQNPKNQSNSKNQQNSRNQNNSQNQQKQNTNPRNNEKRDPPVNYPKVQRNNREAGQNLVSAGGVSITKPPKGGAPTINTAPNKSNQSNPNPPNHRPNIQQNQFNNHSNSYSKGNININTNPSKPPPPVQNPQNPPFIERRNPQPSRPNIQVSTPNQPTIQLSKPHGNKPNIQTSHPPQQKDGPGLNIQFPQNQNKPSVNLQPNRPPTIQFSQKTPNSNISLVIQKKT
ncbi:hypothetical protein TRFO_16887 [Tritrichomonas foetus]|uniref:Uncharacterized protein n=1 Tax=Tritrichomonas foetus TaxID=1144522 RepID=A0A1J4KPF9_9EUKA|nr:hypothetical protein TRFO_16887 [Tritrichomonas foetus]|eukprot:OHT13123.1 hypothetical protein TRFO_16887 [Tritrichomonas foetus]